MIVTYARCERWLWYLFLATFAWQTRFIFWQADTSFIEWRSAALYVSDVCMLGLFLFWARTLSRDAFMKMFSEYKILGVFLGIALFSFINAPSLVIGTIGVIRLIQYLLFFLYLRFHAWHRFSADMSALAVIVGAVAQALLGIAQFVLQHDVGIRWIGETLLRTDMRGVAVFYNLAGEKILRAYGTLPHPNILAAYLMVALWLLAWLWVRHWSWNTRAQVVWHSTAGLLLVGMYLTFSRTIIAVWMFSAVVGAVLMFVPRFSAYVRGSSLGEIRRRLRAFFATLVIVSVGFTALAWPLVAARLTLSRSDEAVALRIKYTSEAIASGTGWLNINWMGVGIGNFTTWLAGYDRLLPAHLVQPVHSIYVLVYAEMGIVGLFVLLLLLWSVLKNFWKATTHQPVLRLGLGALVVSMLIIGLFDHFYWTLQQGRILWWATLALASGKA